MKQIAKDYGMEGRIHMVTFGVASQMAEVQQALQECMNAGYWLILQNAHLSQLWNNDMLDMLKVIITLH